MKYPFDATCNTLEKKYVTPLKVYTYLFNEEVFTTSTRNNYQNNSFHAKF